jgi:D-sedoheptulose 7-phosphate isomerase
MPADRSSVDEAQSESSNYLSLLDGVAGACRDIDRAAVEEVVELLDSARRNHARVYIVGNGGSAATASHMACDLAKTVGDGELGGLRAIALSDSSPLITAWTNDVGASAVFAGQLAVLLDPCDVVIAISVSGNSPNILAALRLARDMGAATVGLLGADGGRALSMVDIALHVPRDDYGVVETVHLGLAHAVAADLRAGRRRSAVAERRPARAVSWVQGR